MAGRKRQKSHKFLQYLADTIKNRLEELGITRYRFVVDNADIISHPALSKIIHAKQGYSVIMLHDVIDRLGLEVKVESKNKPKEETLDVEKTAMLYESGFDTEGVLHPTIGDLIRWLPKKLAFEDKTADFFLVYDSEFDMWTAGYQETDHIFDGKEPIEALFSLLMWKVRIYNEQMTSYNEDSSK